MDIKNTKDIDYAPTLNMLVYGEPGTGKTVFGSTAPNVLIVDAEAGVLSIKDKNVDVMRAESFKDIRELISWLTKPENRERYDTIVLDSVTEIMKKVVDEVRGNKERPTLQDWGTIISKTESMLRMFRDLNKNVIFTALVSEEKDDEKMVKRPQVSGKSLPELLCSFMDIVGYMDVEKGTGGSERRLWIQPNLKYYAKDRSGKLPDPIINPDFTEILGMVYDPKDQKTTGDLLSSSDSVAPTKTAVTPSNQGADITDEEFEKTLKA